MEHDPDGPPGRVERSSGANDTDGHSERQLANRVPPIVLAYWVIKIASTTLGETGADMFSMTLNLGYATTAIAFLGVFAVLLAGKLALGRYSSAAYWGVFTASAILGTVVSDFIDRTLGMGYAAGSAMLVALLGVVLALWYRRLGSISVERIVSAEEETFYWLAFLVANTLGTAAGDYLSDELGIGFLQSALLIGVLLAATAAARYVTRLSPVFLFWVAFVLTRPFGATFGDLLTKPADHGGLGLGTFAVSGVFAAVMGVALWREGRVVSAVRAAGAR
ncbi:MAG: hypothetical protein H6698_04560 [Myxococcales bacterium]|nr:hypothetical protein [Myxococcales bacterium]MCB9531353.1 hypothetical protein [Myxococcales bacterium]MCB9533574.1 hypothetical protein [Myxococcales bacterium]